MSSVPFQDQSSKRVCLGKISGPHGVKGLVKILPFGKDHSLLNGTLYTCETAQDTIQVTLQNPLKSYLLASIEGVSNRTVAQKLKGTKLYIDRSALPEIEEENTFYFEDLVGLKVINEQGEEIGTIIAVDNFGAGDLLEIMPTRGKPYLLPFADRTVPAVDLESGTVTIIPLEEE